jgi:hypothetical protein
MHSGIQQELTEHNEYRCVVWRKAMEQIHFFACCCRSDVAEGTRSWCRPFVAMPSVRH